jgi:GT2 family glycosyltransferase
MITYVILLNWNGWRDTVECLESLFHLRDARFRVVVCDNGSSDGSVERIQSWAAGELRGESVNPALRGLITPACPKPVVCAELSREETEAAGVPPSVPLILIRNGANLGFAGGNNVGLRYALRDRGCEFFWLLNNDTVVDSGALSALLRHMRENSDVGLCGSLNLSYLRPNEVQAQGGKTYRRWTGRVIPPRPIPVEELPAEAGAMDYVNGASMLVSRAFLERVGLMEESYFLYFEELDWAMRAGRSFRLGYARDSVIYHKEGASIGTHTDRGKRSLLSDQYLCRNRVLFTRRFLPWALPTVLVWVLLAACYRLCRGDAERAKAMLVWSIKGLMYRG